MLINGDCLEELTKLEDDSVDLIITDPPYGVTRTKWDNEVDLEKLWYELHRVSKPESAIVMTSMQPFTSKLIQSNIENFKYEIIWEKSRGSNAVHAKYQPLKVHENIIIFSKLPSAYNKKHFMKYYPQFSEGKPYKYTKTSNFNEFLRGNKKFYDSDNPTGKRYPRSVIYFQSDSDKKERKLHPTQKPVKLFEYLIKTYSNIDDVVLDPFAGSGTTGVACNNIDRKYILIEKEKDYYNMIKDRLQC